MSDENKKNELKQILERSFNLVLNENIPDTESAFFNHLQMKLAERIKFFIRTDMDKLMHALYRIDIDDKLSDQAFNLGEINAIAERLAELIMTRQLQKLEYSREFLKKRN